MIVDRIYTYNSKLQLGGIQMLSKTQLLIRKENINNTDLSKKRWFNRGLTLSDVLVAFFAHIALNLSFLHYIQCQEWWMFYHNSNSNNL